MKYLKCIACMVCVLSLVVFSVCALNERFDIAQRIKVATYDVKIEDDVADFSTVLVADGTTYVPLREICWKLGYVAYWEQENWAANVLPYDPRNTEKINVSPSTEYKEEGVIPNEETALAVGKAILEEYAGKDLEYEDEIAVYNLEAVYLENEEAWLVIQNFSFKGSGGGGADPSYFPQIKLHKYTGTVLYINT